MFDQYFNYILLALNPYLLTFPSKNLKMMVEGGGVRVDWFGAVVVLMIKSLMQTV